MRPHNALSGTPGPLRAIRISAWIERALNDAVLGFLALACLFLMIAPVVFELGQAAQQTLLYIEYLIVALFAAEYLAALYRAQDKAGFARSPWRVIDALIILAGILSLLPLGADVLRGSPALRLLRLGRLALLGTRSSLALQAHAEPMDGAAQTAPAQLEVWALGASGTAFEAISWPTAQQRIGTAEPDWLFISGVNQEHLAPVAQALGVPQKAVESLFQSSIPRFDRLERFSTLFVRYPLAMQAGERLRRTSVLLVGTADNVIVLSREHTELPHRVQSRLAELGDETPRMLRATVALIGEISRAYTAVIEQLEATLLKIEATQASLQDAEFLRQTFELRADILRVRGSLKHLKSVVRDLHQGHIILAGAKPQHAALFGLLADDCGDLYDDIEDLRDSLQALVDLRLNVSSFQMNRVMRLLALLTALALIPATAGGLLGMNLTDTPWPATLAQVAFGVAAGMGLSLYLFAIKGWLR